MESHTSEQKNQLISGKFNFLLKKCQGFASKWWLRTSMYL